MILLIHWTSDLELSSSLCHCVRYLSQLRALVYDILSSTPAMGSRKKSANEQFFVGAQTVICLLQTTQIKQGGSFIAANRVYTSSNKTAII